MRTSNKRIFLTDITMRIIFFLIVVVLGVLGLGSLIASAVTAAENEARERKTIEAAKFVCETEKLPDGTELASHAEQQENTIFVLETVAVSAEKIEGETAASKELKVAVRQVKKVHGGISEYPIIAAKWNSYHDISCNTANDPNEQNRYAFVERTVDLPIELVVITSVYGQMDEEMLRDLLSYLPEDARKEIEPFLEDNIGNAKDMISDFEESLKPEEALDQFGKWIIP